MKPVTALLSIVLAATTLPANAADLGVAPAHVRRPHVAHHHRHVHHLASRYGTAWVLRTIGMNYLHNYGPGPLPGTVATYDGSYRLYCARNAAAYLGQDRRPHPCSRS